MKGVNLPITEKAPSTPSTEQCAGAVGLRFQEEDGNWRWERVSRGPRSIAAPAIGGRCIHGHSWGQSKYWKPQFPSLNIKSISWVISHYIKQIDLFISRSCKLQLFQEKTHRWIVWPEVSISWILLKQNQSYKTRNNRREKCGRATGNCPWSLM